MKLLTRSWLLLVFLALARPAFAQEKPFEGIGTASVVAGDIDTARKRALDEAFRQAVEQAVATVVPEAARKANAEAIKKRILRRAKAYVLGHKIQEEKDEGGTYLVRVEARVSLATLQKELAALGIGTPAPVTGPAPAPAPAAARLKVVLLMVTRDGEGVWQTFGTNAGDPGPVATQVAAELDARGYQVVSAAGLQVPVGAEGGGPSELLPVGDAQAAAIAQAAGARAAVIGGAVLKDGGRIRGTPLVGGEADVMLRVLEGATRVADARIPGAGYGQDRGGAVAHAARTATTRAMRLLGERMAARWPPPIPAAPGGGTTVRVRGVTRWSEVAELQKALSQAPGVRSVVPGRFSAQEVAFTVVGGDKAGLMRAVRSVPATPAPVVQQAPDGSLLVNRPTGQATPGDVR